MELPQINYFAVVAATLATMLVGFVFYHPKVFGTKWMRAVGHNEETMAKGASPLVFAVPLICSFFTAWVLAGAAWIAFEFYEGSFFVSTLVTALILYVGFTASRIAVHDAFGPRAFKPTGYTLLNEFLTIGVIAVIIGVWPPA